VVREAHLASVLCLLAIREVLRHLTALLYSAACPPAVRTCAQGFDPRRCQCFLSLHLPLQHWPCDAPQMCCSRQPWGVVSMGAEAMGLSDQTVGRSHIHLYLFCHHNLQHPIHKFHAGG